MHLKMKTVLAIVFFTSVLANIFAQAPPITPAWAFKHVVWEDSINTSSGAITLAESYLEHNIPVSAVIIDSPWSDAYNDFNWDKKRYSDHKNMIKYFSDKNIKVILWLTGAINFESKDTRIQKSENYDYAVSQNYGINNSKPGVWWKGKGIHLDFTNPAAKKWWYTQLDKVFTEGVYGWKVDQGEVWFGDKIETSIGNLSNEEFRKYYYDAMFDYTVKKKSSGIIIARPYSHQGGYAASVDKMSLGWCGDFSGDWKGLKLQIDNIYKSAQKGYGSVGCEVAGFFQKRSNKEEFIRYAQFGAMTATMINGGENGAFSNHLPWFYDKNTEDIYRFCVNLHHQLVPYLFSTVVDAHLNGGSLIKNVSFEEESHQLGNDIFTKAITSSKENVRFTLPKMGEWVDFWTNKVYQKGTLVSQEYPLDRFPLFFRAGSIIPLDINSACTGIGDETMTGKEVFLIYANKTHSILNYHAPKNDGIDYEDIQIDYNGVTGNIDIKSHSKKNIVIIIRNMRDIEDISGASSWFYKAQANELQICAQGGNQSIRINAMVK